MTPEEVMNMIVEREGQPAPTNGWTKLYHPRGPQVTLPVTCQPLDYAGMLANVSAMLDAGWLIQAPGLEAGEDRFDCVAVCRTSKKNDDGSYTPVVHLYQADFEFKSLSEYLNNPEQIAAFEFASGLALKSLPAFPGKAPPSRGAGTESDAFIVQAPRPFGVVMKPNPKYSEEAKAAFTARGETYRVPKRVLVRWVNQKPAAQPASEPVTLAGQPLPAKSLVQLEVDGWKAWLATNPAPIAAINARIPQLMQMRKSNPSAFDICWRLTTDYAIKLQGWRYDREQKVFVTTAERAAKVDASLEKAKANMQAALANVPDLDAEGF